MAERITASEALEIVREPERGVSAAKAASICERTQRLPHFVWPFGIDGTLAKVSLGAVCLRAVAVK